MHFFTDLYKCTISHLQTVVIFAKAKTLHIQTPQNITVANSKNFA
ncbi:hypothetical protein AVU35_gp67 [Enterobacteria phage JenK1]|uniref:Uncharacterized protein n=1 Tax=Enterobacteria phage JenK1 TaxID=1610836 RepID=A0A0E3GMM3_9CAUD|nr:hypothetical protein AVU35_gp67 [Enterobacteria phage JenK1]AKA61107.1 hypothetical protein [Enterobacteria phage JenK1]